MSQFTKREWKTEWNGHFIRVRIRDLTLKTEANLFVDGVLVHHHKGSAWSGITRFEGDFEDENGTHRVKVKVREDSFKRICHIYIYDELIGGDIDKTIALTETEIRELPVEEQRRLLKQQLLRIVVLTPTVLMPVTYVLGICL